MRVGLCLPLAEQSTDDVVFVRVGVMWRWAASAHFLRNSRVNRHAVLLTFFFLFSQGGTFHWADGTKMKFVVDRKFEPYVIPPLLASIEVGLGGAGEGHVAAVIVAAVALAQHTHTHTHTHTHLLFSRCQPLVTNRYIGPESNPAGWETVMIKLMQHLKATAAGPSSDAGGGDDDGGFGFGDLGDDDDDNKGTKTRSVTITSWATSSTCRRRRRWP